MFSFLSLTIKCSRGLVRAFFWYYLEYSDKESNKIEFFSWAQKKCQMNKSKEMLVSIFERRISTRILFEVSKDERISSVAAGDSQEFQEVSWPVLIRIFKDYSTGSWSKHSDVEHNSFIPLTSNCCTTIESRKLKFD